MKRRIESRSSKTNMLRIPLIIISLLMCNLSFALVEFPKNCLEASAENPVSVCHFGTVKRQSRLEADNLVIFMAKETLLKKEKGQMEWVQGTVLFDVSSKSEVRYKNLAITLQKGRYLFFGHDDKLRVDVLEGNFQIGKIQVTEGFQGAFGVLDGNLDVEPLRAINLKEHLIRYARAKKLNRQETVAYLDEFKPKHENYLTWASELNQSLVKRSIAASEQQDRHRRQAQERASWALQKQKKVYFEKVFER